MMPVPKKFLISCRDTRDGKIIMEQQYEAITKEEAKARGLLNCIKMGGNKDNIVVEVW